MSKYDAGKSIHEEFMGYKLRDKLVGDASEKDRQTLIYGLLTELAITISQTRTDVVYKQELLAPIFVRVVNDTKKWTDDIDFQSTDRFGRTGRQRLLDSFFPIVEKNNDIAKLSQCFKKYDGKFLASCFLVSR